jgi:hypothetical protein
MTGYSGIYLPSPGGQWNTKTRLAQSRWTLVLQQLELQCA